MKMVIVMMWMVIQMLMTMMIRWRFYDYYNTDLQHLLCAIYTFKLLKSRRYSHDMLKCFEAYYVSVSISIPLSLFLNLCVCMCGRVCVCVCVCVSLSLSLFLPLSSLSPHLSFSPPINIHIIPSPSFLSLPLSFLSLFRCLSLSPLLSPYVLLYRIYLAFMFYLISQV